MKIEVIIPRCTKPYVGLITGKDSKYGFALDFVREIKRHSAKLHTITVDAPGIYKTTNDVTIGSRGITTGFFRVAADGEVTEITKEEALSLI